MMDGRVMREVVLDWPGGVYILTNGNIALYENGWIVLSEDVELLGIFKVREYYLCDAIYMGEL